jgi:hypothetical protein
MGSGETPLYDFPFVHWCPHVHFCTTYTDSQEINLNGYVRSRRRRCRVPGTVIRVHWRINKGPAQKRERSGVAEIHG